MTGHRPELELGAGARAPEGLPRDMLSLDTQMVWYGATQPATSGMPLMLACGR